MTLDAVLQAVRRRTAEAKEKLQQREAAFEQRLAEAREKLARAESRLSDFEDTSAALENRFDANEQELDDKTATLDRKLGQLQELFGVFQQNASDLIGIFHDSLTSVQYPDRERWLEGFANRMKDASEVSSIDDIERLWYEMQREIAASSRIVRVQASVAGQDGERALVRVGAFNLISNDPQPAYLIWQPEARRVAELNSQPQGRHLRQVDDYLAGGEGVRALAVDPTGGPLLQRLVQAPDLYERIDQGGFIAYLILSLGALALALAGYKLLEILVVGRRVAAQRQDRGNPRTDNALGRLLVTFRDNRDVDTETLAMRLDETVLKERARIQRFTVFLGVIAAVAPLMGLLGTVVGMINTFQAITLYGTGDPQTMAGGISQALVTTVLGLIVAVPTVLLHAVVRGRANAVVDVLRQESAALTGDQMEELGAGETHRPGDWPPPQPSPA